MMRNGLRIQFRDAVPNSIKVWLQSMPEVLSDPRREVALPVILEMDASAWMTYARLAKARGMTIGGYISTYLQDNDSDVEEQEQKKA